MSHVKEFNTSSFYFFHFSHYLRRRLPITLINGVVYNSWTDNELTHGAFSKVMKALYAIDMEEPTPTRLSAEKKSKKCMKSVRQLLQYKILWMW